MGFDCFGGMVGWVLVLWWFGCWCGDRVSGLWVLGCSVCLGLLVCRLLGLWGVV